MHCGASNRFMNELPRGIWERPRGSRVYWIRYTDTSGRRRREKCGSLTNAKQRLAIRHAERVSGEKLTHEPVKSFTLSVLIDDAIAFAEAQNNPYAVKDLKYKLERIREDFGRHIAKTITQGDIVKWLEKQAVKHGWKPASRNRYQAAWSLVFRVAIQNKKARENPAHGLRHKREDNQRIRYLTPDEERRLTEAIMVRYPEYVPIFQLSLHSGMRASEMFRSKVGDLDPRTGLLAIHQTKVRHGDPRRYVPATPMLRAAYDALAAGKARGELLCTKIEPRGGTKEMNRISYWFNPCLQDAGIEDFVWHDLRHTFASRLVMGGMPISAVAQYMGHQSLQMTQRYAHLSPETDSKVRDIMMGYYTRVLPGGKKKVAAR
ncbi:MAG TPA: site-specific integrase [Terracidiphilus sp.]|nr:site-specific integrase [Terracidiphilus sp.]